MGNDIIKYHELDTNQYMKENMCIYKGHHSYKNNSKLTWLGLFIIIYNLKLE